MTFADATKMFGGKTLKNTTVPCKECGKEKAEVKLRGLLLCGKCTIAIADEFERQGMNRTHYARGCYRQAVQDSRMKRKQKKVKTPITQRHPVDWDSEVRIIGRNGA
jgi:hypothetical protein